MKKLLVIVLTVVMTCMLFACTPVDNSSDGSYSSSSYSSKKCAYKEGGVEVCSKTCASGSNFCSYHTEYLQDAYDAYKDFYDSLG